MRLKEKVTIITGAASGIGQAIANRLAKEGANIVVADIDIEQAENTVNDIKTLGSNAIAIHVDVTKSAETDELAQATINYYGKIDILVNNAGGSARERNTLFRESKEEVWDYVVGLNLKGTRNCCRAVINHMLDNKCGSIVNISSFFREFALT